MRRLNLFLLSLLFVSSTALAIELNFPQGSISSDIVTARQAERVGIIYNTVHVPAAVLDAGRVRKQVSFRGNKSARFAEFENLALAPQQVATKRLLNSAVAIDNEGVVNYAALPNDRARTAVKRVETKFTALEPFNPAITGYGRDTREIYGALNFKRNQDARTQARLQDKLSQFQVKRGRITEKLNSRVLSRSESQQAKRYALSKIFSDPLYTDRERVVRR